MPLVSTEEFGLAHESTAGLIDSAIYSQISTALSESGLAVIPEFISPEFVSQLQSESMVQWQQGQFHQAGVGKGEQFSLREQIRTDSVMWLDPLQMSGSLQRYLAVMDELLLEINRSLFLGLHEYEGHVAIYPQGSYYKRHLDQFQNDGLRTVTAILYLNDNWSKEDGGELRIYPSDESDAYQEILPHAGQLVVFLSARFPHEVLVSHRPRLSITGWFKRRPHHILQ